MNREQFDKIFKTYKPDQHSEELYWLVKKVEKINPNTVLEIGMKTGGTLCMWNYILGEIRNSSHRSVLLIGIDIQNNMSWDTRKSKNNVKIIFGDSRKKDTIDKVKNLLQSMEKSPVIKNQNRYIDFLFIDGGHSEDVVTSDYQSYSKFVRKGGIVALHDIFNDNYPGVKRFWSKVDGKKDSCKGEKHGIGIGIIEM